MTVPDVLKFLGTYERPMRSASRKFNADAVGALGTRLSRNARMTSAMAGEP